MGPGCVDGILWIVFGSGRGGRPGILERLGVEAAGGAWLLVRKGVGA